MSRKKVALSVDDSLVRRSLHKPSVHLELRSNMSRCSQGGFKKMKLYKYVTSTWGNVCESGDRFSLLIWQVLAPS